MINLVAAAGFGGLIGPFFGGFLYQLGGYILPLFLFGVINTLMISLFLSKMSDKEVSDGFESVSGKSKENGAVQDQNDANLNVLGFGDIFGFRYSAFGYLS
jgi:Na+/melibiose symporter-like transporter